MKRFDILWMLSYSKVVVLVAVVVVMVVTGRLCRMPYKFILVPIRIGLTGPRRYRQYTHSKLIMLSDL